jgi:Xaa-Pro aminopeptidase
MTPMWDRDRAVERCVTIDNVIGVEEEDFFDTVRDVLEKQGLRGKKTGYAAGIVPTLGSSQQRSTTEAWQSVLGAEPENIDVMVSDLAKIRDEWSMHCVHKAAFIAERGYDKMVETARPGMPEHEVAAILDTLTRELGAEDNFQIVSASQHNRLVHQPMNRRLEMGDVLLGEISPSYEGEYIQICRTAVIGPQTPLQLEKFALLDTALRAGLAVAKPGVHVSEVVKAINEPINDAGYGQYTVPPYMRTRGHSQGLGSMDPQIDLIHDHTLQKGEVFVMHPNQYLPDVGYFMCGEPVVITDEGAQILTTKMGTLDAIL